VGSDPKFTFDKEELTSTLGNVVFTKDELMLAVLTFFRYSDL
jgi:hypothetical protein